ncbi:T9SS type B sorting domain-containing protein [Pedobacter sp. HDW13]|uniref:T9SS type B sorting domain-containing protein n=1 Tax=Pedobacter sp. HDW13 TaxID=2714940 RepID=UPI001407960A|nr:gliding motility-associated C-terminal domain-containing protein [Pedobacter sp. HDW13]QIL38439.1 T9SS type B sorting domain-containing protein [Pedobacter sp. HDW13]
MSKLLAQTFYVSSLINPLYVPGGSYIYKVELTNEGVKYTKIQECLTGDKFFSIAMNKDNLFWLRDSEIYTANMKENSLENCRRLFPSMAFSNSLTLGYNNKLYYCSTFLFEADVNTGKTDILGPLNYLPSGDICFYKKELYMATTQGIVKVNLKQPNKSTLHIPLPGDLFLYGIVSVSTGTRKNTVYGLSNVGNSQTDIIEFDIENQKMVGVVGKLPFNVLDAASMVEDGSIIGIELEKIDIYQDCISGNTANVDISTAPHIEDFTYTLNGVSNSTGKFTGLPKGQYTLSINSASDSYTTTIDVPEMSLIKPVYSWQIKNQLCETPGEITFSTPEQNSSYQIRYSGKLYPFNNTFSNLLIGKSNHFEIVNKYGCKVDEQDIAVGRDQCKIQFDRVDVVQQCDVFHQGIINILTKAHTAAYTYTLNNSISNVTGVFKNLVAGSYQVKISSDEDVFETNVIVPDYKQLQPNFSFVKINPACASKGRIQFNSFTGSDNYQIKLKNDILPYDYTFNNLEIGKYHFTVLSKVGCLIDEFDVELVYEPCPIVINNIEILQECNVLGKGFIKINCPSIPETYTFTLNNSVSNSTGTFNMLDPGSYTIEVKASGGASSVNRTVVVPDYSLSKPVSKINAKNPACERKGEISFSIGNNTADYNIKYKEAIYPGGHVFSDLIEGDYNFTILKLNGCIVDELNKKLVYEPCPIIISNIEIMPECNVLGKAFLKVNCPPIPETYTFTLNNSISNNTGVFNMLDVGIYEIEVKASGGAPSAYRTVVVPDYSLTKPITIVNARNPVCDLTGEISFSIGKRSADYNIRYNGVVYPGNYVFSGLYEGNYSFSILKLNGCIVDELNVALETEACNDISFPTAFSPNFDGVNDNFKAKEGSRAFNFQMQIFDRRGAIIFSSNKLYDAWNGDFKGEPAPVGTYFWVASFTTQENKKIIKKGSVTLIR